MNNSKTQSIVLVRFLLKQKHLTSDSIKDTFSVSRTIDIYQILHATRKTQNPSRDYVFFSEIVANTLQNLVLKFFKFFPKHLEKIMINSN